MTLFHIQDWAGNICFAGQTFPSFEDAWGYIYGLIDNETAYDDYFVVEVQS